MEEPSAGAVDLFEQIRDLHKSLVKRVAAEEEVRRYEATAEELEREVDAYAKACTDDVRARSEKIECDVAIFFQTFEKHTPDLERPRLRIPEGQGRSVELEVEYLGERVSPAYKYLSESQLNSFGLSVFLASVKLLNPRFDFLLLDDVVNSLDAYKRSRLIEVLEKHFDDKQVLLLTHDDVWRDRVRRDLPRWGFLKFRSRAPAFGPRLDGPGTPMHEIKKLLDEDEPEVAGIKLAVQMEDRLQVLCERFEASLKFNLRNEHTLKPLMDGLAARLKKALGKPHEVAKRAQELASGLDFRNLCAHAKNVSCGITVDEVRDVVDRWEDFLDQIECGKPK